MTAMLEARGLSVRLGGRRVVHDASLSLAAGAWTAIVGPNGAGKSTLLSMLAGLRKPETGSVWLQGRAIDDWPARERGRRVAWLSQQGEAEGEIAVRDVVRLGRLPHQGLLGAATARDEEAVALAMRETECEGLARRRLSELSGGERQRVLLARALAVQAPVMLLDEPTTYLDAPHQRTLVRSLRARAQAGAAVAAVLHDLTLALSADRIIVMADGRLLADAAPADAALRQALVGVFDDAFTIETVAGPGRPDESRWVAVPML